MLTHTQQGKQKGLTTRKICGYAIPLSVMAPGKCNRTALATVPLTRKFCKRSLCKFSLNDPGRIFFMLESKSYI